MTVVDAASRWASCVEQVDAHDRAPLARGQAREPRKTPCGPPQTWRSISLRGWWRGGERRHGDGRGRRSALDRSEELGRDCDRQAEDGVRNATHASRGQVIKCRAVVASREQGMTTLPRARMRTAGTGYIYSE